MRFYFAVGLVVAAALWTGLIALRCLRNRRELSNWATRTLAALGIRANGDPLASHELCGLVHGVHIELANPVARALPGSRDGEAKQEVCSVAFSVATPDLIVCRTGDVDHVMGPLPAVPRVLTGQREFDDAYAVFPSAATAESRHGYRESPLMCGPAWAHPMLLGRLCDLGLRWIRVRDGRCEVAFEPLEPEDAVQAALACVGIARSMAGMAPVALARRPRSSAREPMKPLTTALTVSAVAYLWSLVLVLPVGGALLGLPVLEACLWWIGGISLVGCAVATRRLLEQKLVLPPPRELERVQVLPEADGSAGETRS